MGDCTKSLWYDIQRTKEDIKNFSKRVEGLTDDLILYEAEKLIESIKNMIEQKEIVKENMNKI